MRHCLLCPQLLVSVTGTWGQGGATATGKEWPRCACSPAHVHPWCPLRLGVPSVWSLGVPCASVSQSISCSHHWGVTMSQHPCAGRCCPQALVPLHHTSVSASVPEPQCPCMGLYLGVPRGPRALVVPELCCPCMELYLHVVKRPCPWGSPSLGVPMGGAMLSGPQASLSPLPATRWAIRAPTSICEAATCALTSTSSQQW